MVGDHEHPERGRFQPREGYKGDPPQAGKRIHCERCGGPVFLEDVSPLEIPFTYRSRPRRQAVRPNLSGAA
jgi:hypothetical protein